MLKLFYCLVSETKYFEQRERSSCYVVRDVLRNGTLVAVGIVKTKSEFLLAYSASSFADRLQKAASKLPIRE